MAHMYSYIQVFLNDCGLPQLQIEKEAVDFCYGTDSISSMLRFVVNHAKEKEKTRS